MSGDFDFEPVNGLPEELPAGERLLWQGSPRWQDLALHAFHARKVALYFLALGALQATIRLSNGSGLEQAAIPLLWLLPLGLIAAGILTGLAYASARTTVYTMTSKRIVMRIGIALPITLNLPFKLVDAASVRLFANGSGDVPLKLHAGERVAYMILWPHARPLFFSEPQPTLRAIADADRVANLLASALAGQPVQALQAESAARNYPADAIAA